MHESNNNEEKQNNNDKEREMSKQTCSHKGKKIEPNKMLSWPLIRWISIIDQSANIMRIQQCLRKQKKTAGI